MISKNNNPLKNVLSIVFTCKGLLLTGAISVNAQEKKTTDTQTQEEPFVAVEKRAEYVGGIPAFQKYFIDSFRTDEAIGRTDVDTRVMIIVQFIVEKDGSISNIKLLRSNLTEKGNENVISIMRNCPKWVPAEHNRKIVRSQFTLPITIQI